MEEIFWMLLRSKGLKSFGRYGGVGFELLGSIAVGYYVGHYLDGKFGTRWIALVGFAIGCYAGFRALFRAAKTMQRDIERDEMIERGEDPWAPKTADVEEEDEDDRRRRLEEEEDKRRAALGYREQVEEIARRVRENEQNKNKKTS